MEGRWVEWDGAVSDLDSFLLHWLVFFGFLLRRVCGGRGVYISE